jgi:hypothetical protein
MAQPTAGSPARPEAETKSAEEGDARVEEASVSADEGSVPVAEASVSADEGSAPVAEASVSADEGSAPVAEASVSADEDSAPVAEASVDGTPEGASPWDDPDVFGELRPETMPSQVPDTFRPLTRGQSLPAKASEGEGGNDEGPLDVSRFLTRSNPWARTGIGVGVALALGMLGFAISRGPGHSAAEEIVFASSGPHDGPTEALLAASLGIGRACGDGHATSPATVRVTFRSEGNVESAVVTGVYAGTPVGECVAAKVREVRSKPFVGATSTITEQISLSR